VAGIDVPSRMQGRTFLGDRPDEPRQYVYSARDRMDEAFDRIRSVRSARYRYLRNFHSELPYAQWINYADEMPTLMIWRQMAFAGKLNAVQSAFFARTKPREELYDLEADPHETKNIAGLPEYRPILMEHRAALDAWIEETGDLGGVPERELIERGLVEDILAAEQTERVALHPRQSPVP
jgi:hypothetical protein